MGRLRSVIRRHEATLVLSLTRLGKAACVQGRPATASLLAGSPSLPGTQCRMYHEEQACITIVRNPVERFHIPFLPDQRRRRTEKW